MQRDDRYHKAYEAIENLQDELERLVETDAWSENPEDIFANDSEELRIIDRLQEGINKPHGTVNLNAENLQNLPLSCINHIATILDYAQPTELILSNNDFSQIETEELKILAQLMTIPCIKTLDLSDNKLCTPENLEQLQIWDNILSNSFANEITIDLDENTDIKGNITSALKQNIFITELNLADEELEEELKAQCNENREWQEIAGLPEDMIKLPHQLSLLEKSKYSATPPEDRLSTINNILSQNEEILKKAENHALLTKKLEAFKNQLLEAQAETAFNCFEKTWMDQTQEQQKNIADALAFIVSPNGHFIKLNKQDQEFVTEALIHTCGINDYLLDVKPNNTIYLQLVKYALFKENGYITENLNALDDLRIQEDNINKQWKKLTQPKQFSAPAAEAMDWYFFNSSKQEPSKLETIIQAIKIAETENSPANLKRKSPDTQQEENEREVKRIKK